MERRDTKPHDPLTELGNVALKAIEAEPGKPPGLRAVVLVVFGDKGGIAAMGYPADGDAAMVADLLVHVRAVLRASGKDIKIVVAR